METLVDLSRLQFAITAMYHFLFVPLTLGMTWLLVIMESCYVITGQQVYKNMTKFWGKLFGINFAVGVTTGLTMEFQFGTNWAYYSHYVGDIFGAPLAIEGLMAFFLESTFVGLFFFAWDRVSKKKHLMITTLVAIGSNLSAFWILIANGWMGVPLGTKFSPLTMRMELDSFKDLIFNMYSIDKFFHTICAGYVTASLFVLGISSFYIWKRRNLDFAVKSFRIAAIFGFCATIGSVILGDSSGIQVYKHQPSKLAALEGIWDTEAAPVGWSILAWPDQESRTNKFDIKIPYAASLVITRNLTDSIKGANEIVAENRIKIKQGQQALLLFNQVKNNPQDKQLLSDFEQVQQYLGYGLLLKKYTNDIANVDNKIIDKAALDTIPKMLPMYYAFRVMVALGVSFLIIFTLAVYFSRKPSHILESKTWFFKFVVCWIPMPWIAALCGWFVAEYGRQPWTIYEILPTHLSVSSLTVMDVTLSLTGFILIYTVLAVIEMWLMVKYAKKGPDTV